jgi:hypothetical protein
LRIRARALSWLEKDDTGEELGREIVPQPSSPICHPKKSEEVWRTVVPNGALEADGDRNPEQENAMRFLTRLRSEKRSDPAERLWGPGPSRRRATVRPRLEALEDRRLLSAGTLDQTFGSGGIVTTGVGSATSWNGAAAVAIYPNAGTANDGEVVAVGNAVTGQRSGFPVDNFAVIRYSPNGAPDPSFGTGGELTTIVSSSGSRANDVAIQADGKMN